MLNTLTKKRNEQKKKKGFTLIELIIVIAIIAILAAVAIPKFLNVTKDANEKADLANAKTIESTITMLIAKNEISVPTDGTGKVELTAPTDDATKKDTFQNKVAEALQSVPKSKTVKDTNFFIQVDDKGVIHVYAGSAGSDLLH